MQSLKPTYIAFVPDKGFVIYDEAIADLRYTQDAMAASEAEEGTWNEILGPRVKGGRVSLELLPSRSYVHRLEKAQADAYTAEQVDAVCKVIKKLGQDMYNFPHQGLARIKAVLKAFKGKEEIPFQNEKAEKEEIIRTASPTRN